MQSHMPLFQFRLRDGLSIGPQALKRLWSSACDSTDVTVSREPVQTSQPLASHRYCLSGPPHRFDLAKAEARLQSSLQARFPAAHVALVRLV